MAEDVAPTTACSAEIIDRPARDLVGPAGTDMTPRAAGWFAGQVTTPVVT